MAAPGVDQGASDGVSTRSSKRKLSDSNATDESEDGPSKKPCPDIPTIRVEQAPVFDDEPAQPEPAKRGSRGGGRPRGRGRGRGGRGSRGGATNSARGTPARDLNQSFTRGGRGRGGGRVKRSDNARIQALYHRKKDLKMQFRQVAAVQREALTELSQRSLESLDDPGYLESLPEFKEVTEAVEARYKKVIGLQEARMKHEAAFSQRRLDDNVRYSDREFKFKIADIRERYEAQIKQEALYVERQARTGGDDETTPYYQGLPDEVVKYIHCPQSIVHPIATPYYPGHIEAEPDLYQPEVHPADWWSKTLNEDQRKAWRAANAKQKPIRDLSVGDRDDPAKKKAGRKGKNASPTKGKADSEPTVTRMKSALYRPALRDDLEQQNDTSMAATPADVSETDPDPDSAPTPDGDIQAMDRYGTYLPNKPVPRNGEAPPNRFVQKPHLTFEDHEIGVRDHHTKKVQKELLYLGSDPSPNPASFHFDRFVRGDNTALNGPDDLDPVLVETHRVHPTYGLPVPGCDNPDPPTKTDWTKDLEPTNPIIFVEKETENVFHTSRSAWIIDTARKWDSTDVDEATRDKVRSLLESFNSPEASQEDKDFLASIDPSLLAAVNNAPPPGSPHPPRRQFYDAARDTTSDIPYQTPYSEPAKRPGQNLTALADASELVPRGRSAPRPPPGYPPMAPPQWQPQPQQLNQHPPQFQPQFQPQLRHPPQLQPQPQPQQYQPQYPPPPQYPPQPQYAPQPQYVPQMVPQPQMGSPFYHHQPPPPLPQQPQPLQQQHPRGLRPLAPAPPLPPPAQWPRFRHS